MDYQTIYDIASAAVRKQNKYVRYTSDQIIDAGEGPTTIYLGTVPFKKWKVVAYGGMCIENGTHSESISLNWGAYGNGDGIGIATFTQTNPSVVKIYDYFADDPQGITAGTSFADTGCSVAYTNGSTDIFNVWQNKPKILSVRNATDLTSGKFFLFFILEVDTGSKW